MATYVKGNAVENATSYELFEKSGTAYKSLAEASEINFEVSALGLASGSHNLVVKAKADGYADSDYSNEVTYTVEGGTTWYIDHGNQLLENNVDISSGSGLGITVGAFAFNDDTNALLVGKEINAVQLFVHTAGTFTFYRWNKSGGTFTAIESFTLANPSTTLQTYKFTDSFTLAEGEYLAFGSKTDVGKPYYFYNIDFGDAYNEKLYYQVSASGGTELGSLCNLGMNIGYMN